jgi:hypothetical protein
MRFHAHGSTSFILYSPTIAPGTQLLPPSSPRVVAVQAVTHLKANFETGFSLLHRLKGRRNQAVFSYGSRWIQLVQPPPSPTSPTAARPQ